MSYRPTIRLIETWKYCQLLRARSYSPPLPPWYPSEELWIEEWPNEPPLPFTLHFTEEWVNNPALPFSTLVTEEWG